MPGLLYVVATPIGNLKDITLRAIEVFREVDFIVAEDRQKALKLLSHLDIRKPIITINSYNEKHRAGTIAGKLAEGKTAALISAAGTPCISDPGDVVVRACVMRASRSMRCPALRPPLRPSPYRACSPDRFLFYGFLPLKRGKKKKVLREVLSGPYPVVLFESPGGSRKPSA